MKIKLIDNLQHDGKDIAPGTVLDVDQAKAEHFIELGVAEYLKEDEAHKEAIPLGESKPDQGQPVNQPAAPNGFSQPAPAQPSTAQIQRDAAQQNGPTLN